MFNRRDMKMLLIGGTAMSAALLTAWSIRPEAPVEPAPMEEVLAEVDAAAEDVVTWDITVTRNERVDDWIDFLTGRNRDRTKLWLERSGKYGPMIQAELRERGMPEDLLYLALIESGFSPKAYSSAAASGIWQFIAETGQRYGLEVNGVVDERRDPIESTDAALNYLQDLYDRFGSWYLAAASYNTGENRVGRIMREMYGTERGTDEHFWKIAHRLPRETRDYVPLMLAAGHIAKEPEKYGFEHVRLEEPLSYEEVVVDPATPLEAVAKAAGTTIDAIQDLNPHFTLTRTRNDRRQLVRVPEGTRTAFMVNWPTVRESETLSLQSYRVRAGDSLLAIARRHGVSVEEIQRANRLSGTRINAGQTLEIPSRG